MTSLSLASQGECGRESPQARHWRRRAASLEDETEILGRIIRIHEATLEEISELVFQQLEGAKKITIHQLMAHYAHPSPKMHPVEQQIHQEIAAQIAQLVTNYRQNFIKTFENVMTEHSLSVGDLKKQLRKQGRVRTKATSERGDCDTSIQEHPSGKLLFEIPIEVQVLRETADSDVQVDMFSSAKNIYEVPIELKEIFEIPIELNTLQFAEKHRIFEVPVEIDEIFEVVQLEGNQEYCLENIIQEGIVFTEVKSSNKAIEIENASLRAEIEKLLQQINNLKQNQSIHRQIYEIPVEMESIGEADLNSSRCEVYMPNIDSQSNLEKQPVSYRYDSIKQAESKISTQVCTRPDLDLSPLLQRTEGKSSIILSNPTPIQESITYQQQSSSLRNFNIFVSQRHISQVEEALEEGSDFIQEFRDVPVEIEMDGETIEIEMEIVNEVETSEQEVQTDPQQHQASKGRIAKIPMLKIVEIPYEVERIVERILKVPVLKIVEVPIEVDTPQIMEIPVEISTAIEQQAQEQTKITLKSANHAYFIQKAEQAQKVVVKQVPIEVIIERQLPPRTIVKEVPIEVYIERIVQLPPRTIVKQLPIEVVIEKEIVVQKEVIVQKQVIVEKIIYAPAKTILKEIPMEIVIEKEIIVERFIELPPKTIIKQVPIEVILEKQVIVEKIIQLPGKTIIKEVPIEVLVQRIAEKTVFVEMPVRTIIKEVPVQVLVEKIVERTIIKEVPIEVIVQRIIELPAKTIIKEVPVEVIIEKQVQVIVEKIVNIFHEVPVEVIVQKEVKKIEVREVPVEVIVQKLVEIIKIKQVPVEVLVEVPTIVQVPVQVIVEKKVQIVREIPYEVVFIQQVEVPVIQQVPVEVVVEVQRIVEVVKIVKEIVEVPVMICMEEEMSPIFGRDLTISEVPVQSESGPHLLLQSHYPTEHEEPMPAILELPVEVIVEREVMKIREVPIELLTTIEVVKQVSVPRIVQIPIELLLVEEHERVVYVEKIVEVPIEVIIEKTIYIQQIVEVPVQIIVEKQVIINNTQIVEVPIEVIVYRDRFIEVPVQVIIQKEVFVDRIVEVPVEMMEQEDFQLNEVPIQMQDEGEQGIKLKSMEQMHQYRHESHGDYEITYEVPAEGQDDGQDLVYNINANLTHEGSHEIIIQIPMSSYERAEQMDNEAQTESVISHEFRSEAQTPSYKLNNRPSYEEVFTSAIAIQTVPLAERVTIIEMPIEVENINFEQIQKEVEIKYRDYLGDLKERYGAEITELAKSVVDLQAIIIEVNAEKETLREKIQSDALREQSLLKELQFLANDKQEEGEVLAGRIERLQADISLLNGEIEILRTKAHGIQNIPAQMDGHLISEVMEKAETKKKSVDTMMQTEDIRFTLPEVLEMPVHLYDLQVEDVPNEQFMQVEAGNEEEEVENEWEEANEWGEAENEEEGWKVGQLNAGIREVQPVNVHCQTDGINFIYEIPLQVNMVATAACFEVQTDFTVHEAEDIIVLRETPSNPYDVILEIPTELIQPVVYEIPTELDVVRDIQHAEIQTEPLESQRKIFELPVEFRTVSETNQAEIQTLPEATNSSEQNCSSQEEKRQSEEEELVDRVAQRRQHQMSQDSFFRKKKPYSEYFNSRIFEIPIEINLNKEDPLKLLSIEVQTEASELSPVLDEGISNIILSRQRELIVSNLRIVTAFEPLKVIGEASSTPLRRSPERKIFRFGSENDTLGVNGNFSNVHSMTPNQLDGSSSYDKFPLPAININNISLIKKSSIHSEGKFFGSLDMRDELLTHEEAALASVRMANKKLAGFEQGESSSQEGDLQNEMIIEENETIISRDINRIQTPNLEPHDLNFSDYATLREKLYEPEEEKINYQELYDNAHIDLESLKQKLYLKGEELADLKLDLDRESCRYQEQIRKICDELAAAHKEIIEQEAVTEGHKTRVSQLQEAKAKLERKIEMLFQNWQRLKDESEKNEIASGKEFDRLRAIISEKLAEIKELRADEHHQKEAFEGQLHEYREVVRQKSQIIQELEEELVAKNDRIEQLSDKLEDMRKTMSHHNEADTAAIYEQEFQRVKEVFEDQKRQLNYQYLELKDQNEQLRETIAEEERRREELEVTMADLERQVQQAKHDYSSLHHLKSELENNFMEGVKCLNQELEEMKDLVREKEEIIHHINPSLHVVSIDQQPLRVEQISKQPSLVGEGDRHLEAYSRKLQNLLKKYERIIIENAGRIQELQEKVYEYLKDALEKEQEAEGLYMKLVDYENTINNILVEKVTLDIENKRLCKQIELSEKKLNVLGTRLIEVARNRAEYDSDEDYCYD